MEANNNCKVILLGDANVGKTTFFRQFCEGTDEEVQFKQRTVINTIGLDCKKKKICCGGVDVNMQLWDTAG